MGASLAEIITAHGPARSVAFYVTVNGEPVLRKGWDMVPAHSDIVEAVVLPRGGEDSKSVLGIVALIALSAFAPWAGGLIAGALGASSTGIIAGLAGAAILAGGGILINTLLAPKPASTASTDLAASPTYTANPSGNQARLYQTIPVQYGEHLMVPDYVSDPYQEFDGNDQYLHLLFGRGLGRAAPKDVRIGETVVWNDSEGYTGSIDDIEIEFYEPGEQVTLFPVQVETSSEVGGQLMEQGNTLGPYAAVPAGETAQKLAVDVVLPEGCYHIENDGAKQSATVQFHFQYREIDDLGAPVGAWQTLANETLTLRTTTPQRFSYAADVPVGRYEVKADRINAWSDGDQTFDRLEWAGLRAYLDGPQSFADLSTMAVKVKVNGQLTQQSSQDFRLVQCRILPVWNGVAWIEQETRSIAWAAVDVARNALYGAGEADSKIDFATFMAYDALWDARGDYFDGIFDTRQTRFDVINTILGAGRASVRFAGDQISMVRDEQRTLPSQVFSDRNIVRGSLEVTYDLHQTDSADDVIVEYMDATSWTTEEVRCTIAQSTSEAPARVRMIGPTNRDQAWREGIHLAADNYFRREKATFRTELEGRLVARGDLIRIQSDMPQTWGKSGTVKAYSGLTVTLDREPETDPANTYIRFRQKNGEEWGPCKITWTPGAKVVSLDSDDYDAAEAVFGELWSHLDDNGGDAPVYLLGEGFDFTFNGIVLGMVPEGKRVRLEVVRENAAVYLADDGLTVPDYPSGTLLPPSSGAPVIQSMTVARELSVTESFLSVSALPGPGAKTFKIEISYDEETWAPVYEGSLPVASVAVLRDALWVRMQAIGDRPGPYKFAAVAAAPAEIRLPDGVVVQSAANIYDDIRGTVPAGELLSDLEAAELMARELRDSLSQEGAPVPKAINSVAWQLNEAAQGLLQNLLDTQDLKTTLKEAGIDVVGNKVRIFGLDQYVSENDARVSSVEISLDAANSQIALKASLSEVTELIATTVSYTPARRWEWNGTVESWTGVNATLSAGTSTVTVTGTGAGSGLTISGLDIDAAEATFIRFRVRRVSGSNWSGKVEWDTGGGFLFEQAITEPDTPSVMTEITVSLAANPEWNGTVQGLRLTLGDGSTVYELDYLEVAANALYDLLTAGIDARVSEVEADLDAVESALTLKATVADLGVAEGRITTAETRLDGLDATIALKASQASLDAVEGRIDTAEVEIDALQGQIQQSIVSISVDNNNQNDLNGQTLLDRIFGDLDFRNDFEGRFASAVTSLVARTDAGDGALAQSILNLTAIVNQNAASIVSESLVRASTDGALASSINSVSTTVNGHTSSISTLQSSVDGLEAQYVLSVSAGGAVGGFTITGIEKGDGSGSIDFGIAADRFFIVDPNNTGTAVAPLVFQGGTLYLNDLVAVSITADTLSAVSVDLGIVRLGKIQNITATTTFLIDATNGIIHMENTA
ncbi:host specificity factor TipJ family phage tail protein [Roseibium sediminicola]|uniref:Host specificity factor TipJ family phage tail protein n=1 Tax=Roseibium sediminicola TaxID=2933272 RepID=A0ABT0GR80_9HYPH|nr:host specificity factor TipJ family phage tail protein [Roseibium sp. CAU 1639]MCK7611959.1 host specificity factor TipJ family phage tail protein [Roseibium sp. CAU 1639]